MTQELAKKTLAHHWWAILLRGIIAIVFALIVFSYSGMALAILIFVLGLYLVIDGVFLMIASVKSMVEHKHWWVQLIQGILAIIVGILVLSWPGMTALIILYLVAIWAIVSGVFELGLSMAASWESAMKYLAGTLGIVSLILGIVMFAFPLKSMVVIIWLIGIYALVVGIMLVIFSFQLKKLK